VSCIRHAVTGIRARPFARRVIVASVFGYGCVSQISATYMAPRAKRGRNS